MDAKCLGNDRRKDAEEEAVAQAGEYGYEPKLVRVCHVESKGLRDAEKDGGKDETPYTAGAQSLDEKVGADACLC